MSRRLGTPFSVLCAAPAYLAAHRVVPALKEDARFFGGAER